VAEGIGYQNVIVETAWQKELDIKMLSWKLPVL